MCEEVAQKIVSDIEAGNLGSFSCPWFGSAIPADLKTQKKYRGCNISFLWLMSYIKKYDTNYWMTYKQAKELGGHVKKDSKSTLVVFFKKIYKEDQKQSSFAGKEDDKDFFICNKAYPVFNLDQI